MLRKRVTCIAMLGLITLISLPGRGQSEAVSFQRQGDSIGDISSVASFFPPTTLIPKSPRPSCSPCGTRMVLSLREAFPPGIQFPPGMSMIKASASPA